MLQHDRLASVLDEERQKNEDRLKEALQEQLETQKTMLQTCLREERDKNKLELQKATEVCCVNSRLEQTFSHTSLPSESEAWYSNSLVSLL